MMISYTHSFAGTVLFVHGYVFITVRVLNFAYSH